jgi:hypothetical protein
MWSAVAQERRQDPREWRSTLVTPVRWRARTTPTGRRRMNLLWIKGR